MLSDYLPAPLLQSSVTVHSFDACGGAARWRAGSAGRAWRGGVNFDCILLDAPCSSERHVMRRCGAAAENWSKGRLRRDAKTQLRLIDTALSLLNPEGGRLVFSTCSIDPGQNDEVMSKVLKSHGAAVELLPPLLHLTETGIGALLVCARALVISTPTKPLPHASHAAMPRTHTCAHRHKRAGRRGAHAVRRHRASGFFRRLRATVLVSRPETSTSEAAGRGTRRTKPRLPCATIAVEAHNTTWSIKCHVTAGENFIKINKRAFEKALSISGPRTLDRSPRQLHRMM